MSNEQQPDKANRTGKSDQQQPKLPVIPTTPTPSDSPKENKKRFCEKYKHEIEFFGFLAVIVYCVINFMEWQTFNSERRTMESEFKSAQTNMILDQRAFVFATGVTRQSLRGTTSTNYLIFNVEVKNSGKTPAFNFRITTGFDNQTSDFYKIDTMDTNDFMVLAPNAFTIVPLEAVVKNGEPLWIGGTIRYDDIFRHHHWSTFCWKVGDNFQEFYGTSFHNSSDDIETNQTN